MRLGLFKIGFLDIGLIDILDILIVSFIIYRLYLILRRTRAVQMLAGLIVILIVSLIANILGMQELSWIFQQMSTVWLVAFVILFQPELRRVLTLMGQSRIFRFFSKQQPDVIISEVARAAEELSRRGYGGLLVISRETGLKTIIETGVKVESLVSAPLIVSIFNPRSPLHDGAIIIQNDTLQAAKCILPLSRNPRLEFKWGTRHLAAIGMSEESDALVIIVSEETGKISIADQGEITPDLDYDSLQRTINAAMPYGAKKTNAV